MTPNDLNERLKVPTWFTAPRFTAGIPRGTFLVLAMASLFYGLLLAWWLGLLIFIVVYAPLAKAHRDDPNALRVWAFSLSGGADELNVTRLQPLKITFTE
jgi:type IV secretory pathway TrbD component